jgi:hypothetical protein
MQTRANEARKHKPRVAARTTGEIKMTTQLSNAIARKYFLDDADWYEGQFRCCFFSNGMGTDGWGFWVRPDGTVDVDEVSSNGELPSARIVAACVRAAVKHLAQ